MYVVGGKYTKSLNNCRAVQKFDIIKSEWVNMPDMNQARLGPGLFISNDGTELYAFGGQARTIEKIDLTNEDATWEELDV